MTLRSAVLLLAVTGLAGAEVTTIRVVEPAGAGPAIHHAVAVFRTRVEQRSPARVVKTGKAQLSIQLQVAGSGKAEGYEITGSGPKLTITAADEAGILYGLGKLLHTSSFTTKGFVPGAWRGKTAPASPMRGMYLACHFGNFYEAAPIEEVEAYVEDLSLWGVNHLLVSFPGWQLDSFEQPETRRNFDRLRLVLSRAKKAGLKVGLGAGNQTFRTAPKEALGEPYPDNWHRRGDLGTNVCPSRPAGHKYLMWFWNHVLDEFRDPGLDFLVFWPYDEGGCGCKDCWPWGPKGYLQLARDVGDLGRARWPKMQMVLSTWMFDTPPAGEWHGLSAELKRDPRGIDYIMADAHEDFPRYPLDRGVPGGLPLVNFPEISMWGMSPWGGYGASPLTAHLQTLWNQVSGRLAGGFPYSEGIYEDINKVITSQFYWSPEQTARETVQQYASAYFGPESAADVLAAVEILERNHRRRGNGRMEKPAVDTARAVELLAGVDRRLTPQARQSWRWRILYLRAQIDDQLVKNQGAVRGEELRRAFDELVRIYHAEHVHTNKVAPPPLQP